jgi:hypothetical protein
MLAFFVSLKNGVVKSYSSIEDVPAYKILWPDMG